MSQVSPPPEQLLAAKAETKRANGPAIASVVCGIICCIPIVTSLAAVICGVFGMRKANDPRVDGKSLSIAGIILGFVGLAGWSIYGGIVLGAYFGSTPAREVAHQFALDLSSGNIPAAVAASDGMTSEQLTSVAVQMKPWGTLTDTSFGGFKINMHLDTGTTCELSGVATFSTGGEKTYTVRLVKRGEAFKVRAFNLK